MQPIVQSPRIARNVQRWTIFGILLAILLTILPTPSAQAEKWHTNPTGWWWLHGVTAQQITDKVNEGFRMIDIEVEQTSPLRFSAAFVKNSGVHQKGWWWYYGVSLDFLIDKVNQHQARVFDIETYWVNGEQRFAAVLLPNTGNQAKAWWWYINTDISFISDKINQHQARIIDLETYVRNGKRYYSVVMIKNQGADASAWWWYINVSPGFIAEKINQHGARLIDIEKHGDNTFSVVMEKNTGKYWWWYYGVTEAQVNAFSKQNGARVFDVETYEVNGNKRFAVLMLNNANALTTRVGSLLRAGHDGGASGLYLKQVQGPVLASLQADYVFEPASMIKALHHAHAMKQVQNGNADLDETINVFQAYQGSCPLDQVPPPIVSEDLEDTLKLMMRNSDNARTEAVRKRFGENNINATAQALGMSNSLIQHRLGCGSDAVQNPNQLTLIDAGKLYEGVATSFLTGSNRQQFYDLMSNEDNSSFFKKIVDEEAAKLGHSSGTAGDFKQQMEFAWKGGSYGLNGKSYLTMGGWIKLPFKACLAPTPRQYVFGMFIHQADDIDDDFSIFGTTEELLRDEIRSALKTWYPCFGTITPGSGGEFTSDAGDVKLFFPAGAVEKSISLNYTKVETPTLELPETLQWVKGFELEAQDEDGQPVDQFTQPYTLTVAYDARELGARGIDEQRLGIAYRDGTEWIVIESTVDGDGNEVGAELDHFSEFALVLDVSPAAADDGTRVYLPLVLR